MDAGMVDRIEAGVVILRVGCVVDIGAGTA